MTSHTSTSLRHDGSVQEFSKIEKAEYVPMNRMTSHTSTSLRHDGSVQEFSKIEKAEYVPMNSSLVDVDFTASDVGVTDRDKHFSMRMAEREKNNDNTVGLLTRVIDPNSSNTEEQNMPKIQILKNLFLICMSFFLLFTSFHSLSNLQSSINKEEGVGTFSLVVVYVSMMVSSMFLSSVSIDRLGLKVTMCLSMIMYVLYMAANLYPVWAIMVPAALLCGLSAGPLWASQSSYLSHLSRCYAKTTNMKPKDSFSYLFGIFYMFLNASKISGNVLGSIVLNHDDPGNRSMTLKEIEDCVANNQEAVDNATILKRPDDTTIYSISGTWIGLGVVGIIVLGFLTSVPSDEDKPKDVKRRHICNKLMSTVKHLRNSRLQKLMLPVTMYYGISNGFLVADFTKSIVGCTSGIHAVSDVMLCHGICNTISAALIGRLVKNFGHLPFFTFAFLCYGALQIILIAWKPGPEHSYLFFVFAGMWGTSDAILKTQVLAIYGHLFADNTEAAFGNYFVYEAIGFIISFSYSTFTSTDIKLYILLGMLLCSATSYYIVEYISRKQNTGKDTKIIAAQ